MLTREDKMTQKNENNISGRLERIPVTSVQWKLWLCHETCWIFGSVGLGTTTFVLTNLAADFVMDSTVKGLVATVTYLGMLIGATASGMVGDKVGRKTALIGAIILWSISSLFIAFTSNIYLFWIWRFLLGLGMGAHFPQTQSMLAELFPAKYRGRSICLLEGGYPLACILAGILGWSLQMVFPWRSVFVVQGLLGVCIFIVIYLIPESARFYEMRGEIEKAIKIVSNLETKVIQKTGKELLEIPDPIVEVQDISGKTKFLQLFEGSQARKTITMWILWFCVLFGHYGLNTWVSDLLVGKGFNVVRSNGFVILMYLPAIPGYLIATWLVEIVGRKKMVFAYMIFAAIFSYLYGGASSLTHIIIFGCFLQMFNFGIWSLIYTYASEVFPTRIRSTGCGTTSSSGRLGSLVAPTLFGVIMNNNLPQIYIFIIASVIFVIGAFTTLMLGTETKGKSVEEITII
jgi:putative MFS transporter